MTLGESLVEHGSLAKVSQLGWLGTPNKGTLSELIELGMVLIVVYDGSWMKIMLKSKLTLRTVLIKNCFFRHFVKKFSNSLKS